MFDKTQVQILRILAKDTKPRTRRKYVPKVYPKAIENRYRKALKSFFAPLIKYVTNKIEDEKTELLRGDDTETRLDAIAGRKYRELIQSLEAYIETYYPSLNEIESGENYDPTVYIGVSKIADELKDFQDKEFVKQLEQSLGTSIKSKSDWWDDLKKSWVDSNYNLIKSNATAFQSKIAVLVEQAITNGQSPKTLKEEIKKATTGLSDSKCALLARDQIGKAQSSISQMQMEEIGLEMYIWSTSNDDRVRDSHAVMEGLLCRWDDPTVYSDDGGKTWKDRPSGAVLLHAGQDIQCRCVALAYFPEVQKEIKNL